ncbi:MAG: DUF3999 family protein [Acidobacteriaceae bacterium]
MNVRGAVVLLALFAVAPEIQYFHFQRPVMIVQTGGGAGSHQTCLVMDSTIFAHAAPHYDDLRLYGGSTEVPYAIRQEAGVPEKMLPQINPLNLGLRGGQTTFDAAMPDGHYSDIQLEVTGENFIATVQVSGSQSQTGSPETKLGSYTIFDLTNQKLGRSTVLHLPESDFRYLHFTITEPVTPGQIGGLTVDGVSQGKPRYVTVDEYSQLVQKGDKTSIQFTVPANVPVDRIEFFPGAQPANFSRDVTIKVAPLPTKTMSEDEDPQTVETTGNLLRLHGTRKGHRIDEEHTIIDAPWRNSDTPATIWTITIDNGDDPPLPLNSVRLEMAARELCFDAMPGVNYTLFYGDPALSAPRYDYAKLFMPAANAALATLGPELQNPRYQPRPDVRPFTERHPALLWAALVLVVAVLGIVALRTAKQPPPNQQ